MIHDARLQFVSQTPLASGWLPSPLLSYFGSAVQVKQIGDLVPYNTGDYSTGSTHLVIQFDTLPSGGGITSIGACLVSGSTSDLLAGAHYNHWSSFDHLSLGSPIGVFGGIQAGVPHWVVPLPQKIPYLNFLGLVLFANAAPTAGTVSTFVTPEPPVWTAYRDASN